jgi:hypothetical protein
MKTLAASAVVLVTLCAPALADPPREDLKIRFALRDTTTTQLDVIVGAGNPCATASEKHPGREIELRACMTDPTHVDGRGLPPTGSAAEGRRGSIDVAWSTRSAWGEYSSTSSLSIAHGTIAELGSAQGPHLTVTVQ